MAAPNELSILEKITLAAEAVEETFPVHIRSELIFLINKLIMEDFASLVQLLYRIDVNEKKVKHMLSETKGANAAEIIADLIIKRQQEKINSKKQYKQSNDEDAEKW